jgi:hypothetical protein
MRPAGSDSREKWRENAGGKMIGMDQYLENNRKMYTMENVPTATSEPALKKPMNLNAAKPNYDPLLMTPAEIDEKDYNKRAQEMVRIEQQYGSDKGGAGKIKRLRSYLGLPELPPDQAEMSGIYTPSNAPGSYTGPEAQSTAPKWQQDLTVKFPELGREGAANDKFKSEFTPSMSKAEVDALAERSMGDYSSSPQPETTSLQPLIAKTDPYGTMLNDRPGGGRTYESPFLQPRPMGSGTLSQRPTSTASGASERVAYRRAIRMDPKSTEEDRRFARGIGGARNSSYGNYD